MFEWHPSEATGLLCAAAAGARGTPEIRDRGFPVTLTDHTPEVHKLTSTRVFELNRLARAMASTRSLAAVEDAIRANGRDSEIDYEWRKAQQRHDQRESDSPAIVPRDLTARLDRIRSDALARGADFITLRGLAERLELAGPQLAELQRQLRLRHPDTYTPPIWAVRAQPATHHKPATESRTRPRPRSP